MNRIKIFLLIYFALLPSLSHSQISENIFSSSGCAFSNNSHFMYTAKGKQYAQLIMHSDGNYQAEYWELIKQSKNFYTLRNTKDPGHIKTFYMSDKSYVLQDVQKGNVRLVENGIDLKTGKQVSTWYDCPDTSPSGSDGQKKLATFFSYEEKKPVAKKSPNANPTAESPVNEYIKKVRKQCEEFPAVEKRCATAGDIDRCIKIYLPDYDPGMCYLTQSIK